MDYTQQNHLLKKLQKKLLKHWGIYEQQSTIKSS